MAKKRGQLYRRIGLGPSILAAHAEWGEQAKSIIVDAVFYMGTDVKSNTPYKTGRAVAHWQVALNGRPGGYDPTRTEARGMALDVSALAEYRLGDRIHLYNKAPYGPLLEEGWSEMAAPGQMLRAQAERFQEYLDRAASDYD